MAVLKGTHWSDFDRVERNRQLMRGRLEVDTNEIFELSAVLLKSTVLRHYETLKLNFIRNYI